MPPRPANFFVFLVESGFHHVGQAELKLLTSGNLPALASQSAGITGVGHHARLAFHFLGGVSLPGRSHVICSLLYTWLAKKREEAHACNPSTLGGQGR